MTTKTTTNLVVAGFIHEFNKEYESDIPDDIIMVIMIFYPQWIEFEGINFHLFINVSLTKQTINHLFHSKVILFN